MPRVERPYLVTFDARARQDLRQIFEYLESRAGPGVAERITAKLYQHCASFSHTPERGTKRDELRPGLRTIGYRRRATIVFSVDRPGRKVVILGVYYGGRNYSEDFADED